MVQPSKINFDSCRRLSTIKEKIMSKLLKLIVAAAGGFVAGILLAPKSGKETREDLKLKADEAKIKAKKKADDLKVAADEGTETFRRGADVASREVVEFGRSAKATAEKIAAEAAELGGEARTRAARVASDAKKTAQTIEKDAEKRLR